MRIRSIRDNQHDTIRDIIKLHIPQGYFDLDMTYSKGVFYRPDDIPEPTFKIDIEPQVPDVLKMDCRKMDFVDDKFKAIMIDPPFLFTSKSYKTNKEGSSITTKRFGRYDSWDDLKDNYYAYLKEAYRVLKKKGVLVFKVQDSVSSGKQFMTHILVCNYAHHLGYYSKDIFLTRSKSKVISPNWKNQHHSDKYHCYWWVFQKDGKKVSYE